MDADALRTCVVVATSIVALVALLKLPVEELNAPKVIVL